MEDYIKNQIEKIGGVYVKINNDNNMETIYNLLKNDIVDDKATDSIVLCYYGVYYQYVKQDYDKMKKYYIMAIKNGNIIAMNNLGVYYCEVEKSYEKMKKYYLMAINNGYSIAMSNMGFHYEHFEINYDKMKEYYLMAINNGGGDNIIYNLHKYYENNVSEKTINDAIYFSNKYSYYKNIFNYIHEIIIKQYNINIKYNHNFINKYFNSFAIQKTLLISKKKYWVIILYSQIIHK